MNHTELVAGIRSFVAKTEGRCPDDGWSTVRHLLDMDETDEAMDVLVATLVRDDVPISPAERDSVRTLMAGFALTQNDRAIYRYLGDAEMLDRMTVVEEPST